MEINFLKEFIKKPLESIWSSLEKEVQQIVSNRLIEYQSEEYERNYYSKTIVHRTSPVKLNSFYQPLFIRRHGFNYKNERIPTSSAKELFEINQFITVLGTAGSGKSTIVKYLLIKSIEEQYKIPIKIELRYLNEYKAGGLHKYIEDEIFKLDQLAFEKKIITRLLNSGNFLIFFDGYDELSSIVKEKITKDINDFTRIYNKNSYLLTSRPYTNIELLARFSNFEVCPLNDNEIEEFVKKQIPVKEKEIISKIIETIKKDNSKSYKSYLQNPLLLSMFILTYQTYSIVPHKKSDFYKQVFDSLFYLHDSMSKLSYEREKKAGLSKNQFEDILKRFSFISTFKEVFVFTDEYLNEVLDLIKQKKNYNFNNACLIEDLQIAICILNKEGLDYVFPHRSLQEYFASLYIVSLDSKNKQEAYSKILKSFDKFDLITLITKDNFFSLLIEQDEFGVIRNLSLPFLQNILKDLKSRDRVLTERFKKQSESLIFYLYSFHRQNEDLTQLFKIITEFSSKRQEIFKKARERQSKSVKIDLTSEETIELKQINSSLIKNLKLELPKSIKVLNQRLLADTKSDNDLINMI